MVIRALWIAHDSNDIVQYVVALAISHIALLAHEMQSLLLEFVIRLAPIILLHFLGNKRLHLLKQLLPPGYTRL